MLVGVLCARGSAADWDVGVALVVGFRVSVSKQMREAHEQKWRDNGS